MGLKDDYELTLYSWMRFVHPDDTESLGAYLEEQVVKNKLKFDLEYRIIHQQTTEIKWVHGLGSLEFNKSGEVKAMFGTVQDITERKKSALKISESEAQLKTLFDQSPVAKILFNLKTLQVETSNKAAQLLYGYSEIDFRGLSVMDLRLPNSKNELSAALKSLPNNGVRQFQTTHIKKNGDEISVMLSASKLFAADEMVLLAVIDETERRKTLELLHQQRHLLEESQAIAKVGGWELDIATGNLFWTDETYRLHDTNPEEFNPTVDAGVSYFLPESRKIISKALEEAIEKGKGYDLELETYTTKGRLITVRTTCRTTVENGKTTKLTGIFQDITETKLAEQQLKWNYNEITRVDKLNQAMLNGTSITDMSTLLLETIDDITDVTSSRVYTYDPVLNKLELTAQHVENGFVESINKKTGLEFSGVIPTLQKGSLLKNILDENKGVISNNHEEIIELIKDHTDNVILKTLARWVVTLMDIETFAVLPIFSNQYGVLGLMTLTASTVLSDKQKATITRFVNHTGLLLAKYKAETSLKHSEEQLQTLFDNSTEEVYLVDPTNLMFVNVNETACKSIGYSKAEMLNMKLPSIVHADFNLEFSGTLLNVLRGKTELVNSRAKRKDGSVYPIELKVKAITMNGKKMMLAMGHDLTQREQAEQEIRKVSKAVEQSPVTVVITDLDGNIEYVNKKFEEVTGYTAAEAIGKNPRILKSGETPDTDYSNLWETILDGKTWHGEFHNVKKDGSLYWEQAAIGPILNNDGEIINLLAVKEDITKQKEAEKDLKETLEHLEVLVNERTAALYQTTKQLEASTKDLISSMQYAKRIQEASIPSLEELQHGFADAFAMYLPKDIVSGDFYWKYETESEILIALVDCTGHGVPGALMSMAGNEALDNIIVSRTISRPDIILEEMDLTVKQLLRRKQGALKVADGMDMSIVHIDKSKKIFSYAGAQSHGLFISGAEVTALKPDRMSIGGISSTKYKEFKRTRINYQPGDKFYLFSDGYYDQFGEKTGKKLLRKVFTNLLKEHSSLSITEQGKEIVEQFYSWKGNLQQIDDVTVLGFEL